MRTKRVIKFVLFAMFLVPSFAAYSAGGTGDRLISYIEVMADGGIIIQGTPNFNNPDGCSNPKRVVILSDNQFLNQYYAAALTAYSTENYIWAWVKGCWTAPWGEVYPIVVNAATKTATP